MGRYSKNVKGVDHHYQPADLFEYAGEPFDVRISILDEPPDGGLWVTVDGEEIGRSIGQLLDEFVVGADAKQTEFIREHLLELDEFPHLTDALDWVADLWHRFRAGDATLGLCVNHGPDDIALEDTAREHMATAIWRDGSLDYMLLDLVLEPGEMTLLGMLGERMRDLRAWMRGMVALYMLDTDDSAEKALRKREDLVETREYLIFHNLVTAEDKGRLAITQQGRRAIASLLDEQDDLIRRFDVFRDVVIRSRSGGPLAEFGTLAGADYRVAVYKHAGVDPYRAVFLLSLLSRELDDELQRAGWLELLNDDRFYERILAPVVDHSTLPPETLDTLVAQGQQHLARTSALRDRARYSQGVLRRARTVEAFPRASSDPDPDASKRRFTRASARKRPDELGDPPPAPTPPAPTPPSDLARTRTTRFKKSSGPGPGRPPRPAPGDDDDDDR